MAVKVPLGTMAIKRVSRAYAINKPAASATLHCTTERENVPKFIATIKIEFEAEDRHKAILRRITLAAMILEMKHVQTIQNIGNLEEDQIKVS